MMPLYRRTVIGGLIVGAAASYRGAAMAGVMKIECSFNSQIFKVTLEDNPTSRDLLSLLPLSDLSITDYSTNEKIAYLPRKLMDKGAVRFGGEAQGDLCYYAPWGNLAFFHAGYRWSQGLIRLGRLDGGAAPLLVRGTFPLRIHSLA